MPPERKDQFVVTEPPSEDGLSLGAPAPGPAVPDGQPQPEPEPADPQDLHPPGRSNRFALLVLGAALLFILFIGVGSFVLFRSGSSQSGRRATDYAVTNLPLKGLPQLRVTQADHLTVNGPLQISSTLTLTPSSTPSAPAAGEFYYNQATNTPYYYNGTQFVSLAPATPQSQPVTSINGVTGGLQLGSGLRLNGTTISLVSPAAGAGSAAANGGVTSLAGTSNQINVSAATGNVTLSLPQDIGLTSTPTFGGLTLQGGGALNVSSGGFTTALTFETPTANSTITIPAGVGGTICTSANNCGYVSPTNTVSLQSGSPGTAQTGNINISGTAIVGTISSSGTITVDTNTQLSSTALVIDGVTVCTVDGCSAAAGSGNYIQNGITTQTANYDIQSASAGDVAATIEGASGQTADLLDLKDGSGNKVVTVGSTGDTLVQPSTDSTTAFQVQNAGGADVLDVDTQNSLVTVTGANSNATLGSEMFTSSESFPATTGWTSISGTGSSATATHTSGTTALSPTPALNIVAGQTYQVTFTITGNPNSAQSVTPSLGGVTGQPISGNHSGEVQLFTATTTDNLAFTPTSTWNGTISDVSVIPVTLAGAALQVEDSSGNVALQVNTSGAGSLGYDTFIGLNSGQANIADMADYDGVYNTAVGADALQDNTTGAYNTAQGYDALQNDTTGGLNTAVGVFALQTTTTGHDNTAVGAGDLQFNTTGYANAAVGFANLVGNTTGANNTVVGNYSLYQNTTGNYNVALGANSLYFNITGSNNIAQGNLSLLRNTTGSNNIAIGATALENSTTGGNNTAIGENAGTSDNANTTGSNNTFLGYNTGLATSTQLQNATAVGARSVVGESNALVLGCVDGTNGCSTNTEVGIDNATPGYALDVNGNVNTNSEYLVNGSQIASADLSDGSNLAKLNGTNLFQPTADSTTAFEIQNAAGTTTLLDADTTDGLLGVGAAPTTGGSTLQVTGTIASSGTLTVGTNTQLSTSALVIDGVTVCTVDGCDASAFSGDYIQNGIATQTGNFNIQSASAGDVGAVIEGASGQTADLLDLEDGSGNPVFSVGAAGSTLIQNTASADILEVDTSGNTVTLGGGVALPPSGGGTVADGGNWSTGTSIGTSCGAGVYGATSAAYNGYLYLLGGTTGGTSALSTVCYAALSGSDGSVGTWAATTSLPTALYNASTVVNNGYVYVMGGTNGSSDQTTIYYAQLQSDGTITSWNTATTVLPYAGGLEQASTVVNNGYLYLLGGLSGSTVESSTYYAPINSDGSLGSWSTTNSWSAVSGAGLYSADSVVNNGYIYIMSGSSATSCSVSNNIYYAPINSDGSLGSWSTTSTGLYYTRVGANAVVWGGYYYMLSGTGDGACTGAASITLSGARFQSNGDITSDIVYYPGQPYSAYYAAATVYDGYVYQLGGTTNGSSGLTTVQYASLSGSNTGTPATGGSQAVNLTVHGDVLIRPNTDSTTAFQVQNAGGSDVLNVDTQNSIVTVTGGNSNAALGSEMFTSSESFPATTGWTSISGTGSSATAKHTSGTTALSPTPALNIVAGQTYQVTFTVSGNPNGAQSVTPSLGGVTGQAISGNDSDEVQLITATTTDNLAFTPTSSWTGTISGVSVIPVTPASAALQVKDSSGYIALQVRTGSGGAAENTFIGLDAGESNISNDNGGFDDTALGAYALQSNTAGYADTALGGSALYSNTTGYQNTALGSGSLYSNTTGAGNTAVGSGALEYSTTGNGDVALGVDSLASNTAGSNNTATGTNALAYNTTGNNNTATGYNSLERNTTGGNNTVQGYQALNKNTGGSNNTVQGYNALFSNTTGGGNVALGYQAGYTSASGNANTTGSYNTFIGYNAGPGVASSSSLQAATAIGTYATVDESNALVLGCVSGTNGCSTSTLVGIGTATPAATLDVEASSTNVGLNVNTTGTGNLLQLQSSGTAVATVTSTGATTFENSSNSTAAFQVQNAGGADILSVDTTDSRVNVGTAGTPTGQLYVSGMVPSSAIGSITNSNGTASKVAMQGKYAYVASYGSSPYPTILEVYDVSDPTSPVLAGSVTDSSEVEPEGITVQGNYAYVVTAVGELAVFDISNPASPVKVGSLSISGAPELFRVVASGRYVYVVGQATSPTAGVFDIVDVANPAQPDLVGTDPSPLASFYSGVTVKGSYAYVIAATHLRVFNISDKSNPTIASTTSLPSGQQVNLNNVSTVSGNKLYLAEYGNGSPNNAYLQIFDVSDPSAPTSDNGNGTQIPGTVGIGVIAQGDRAYVLNNDATDGLNVVDVSDAASPQVLGSVTAAGAPTSFAVQGRYAYVWSNNELQTFDLGGEYAQQLQAGGTETGTLQVDNDAAIGGDEIVQGGLSVGQSVQVGGDLGVNGQTTVSTDSTTAFQVQNSAGSDVLNVDTTNSIVSVTGADSNASLGSEMFTSSESFPATTGWTSISGTGSSATATHTSGGGTTALSPTPALSIVAGQTYQVTFTITGNPNSAQSVTPSLGGVTGQAISGNDSSEVQIFTAASTDNLAFTPTSTWNGTISGVSVMPVTLASAALQVEDNSSNIALQVRTSGAGSAGKNTFIGLSSGESNTTGSGNTALGVYALQDNTTGDANTAIGANSLQANTTGQVNVAVGTLTLNANTTGSQNTALGFASLAYNTTGYANTAAGDGTLEGNTTGKYNTATGADTLGSNTTGSYNTGTGAQVLASNTTGSENTAEGNDAMFYNTTGGNNTAQGNDALFKNTSGSNNTVQGYDALYSNTTGSGNVALGYQAGYTGTSGNANTTGSNNTFLGYDSGPGTSTQLQNSAAIGAYALVDESNALVLGCIDGTNGCTTSTDVGIGTASPANLLSVNALTTAVSGAQVAIGTGATGNIGEVIQGVASQSADLLDLDSSTGGVLDSFDASGDLTVTGSTSTGSLTVTAAASVGSLTVTGASTFGDDITVDGHVITGNSGGTTTAAAETGAGTGATCTLTGDDTGGQITLTTGTGAWAAGAQCTVTFAQSYTGTAPNPVISPASATDVSAVGPYVSATDTTFTVNFINADTAQPTYTFIYFNAQ